MKYQKQKIAFKPIKLTKRATEVLYSKMMFYEDKAKYILEAIIDELKKTDKAQAAHLIAAYKKLRECDDIVIDCATKLAPYQTPKLESIEVNKKVEHRYVIRAPAQMKTTDEWIKATGANNNKEEYTLDIPQEPKPFTIHDMSEDDEDIEDERRTLQ